MANVMWYRIQPLFFLFLRSCFFKISLNNHVKKATKNNGNNTVYYKKSFILVCCHI